MDIIKKISMWACLKLMKKKTRKQKAKDLIKKYNQLIHDYRLIQEKNSPLSRRERDLVEAEIKHLISIGHLNVVS